LAENDQASEPHEKAPMATHPKNPPGGQ